jgi:ABC-type multidrug transport system fused ATPase/permease subunit
VHEGLRIQHIQQGMGGVKDIKLLGRADNFLDEYQVHNTGSAQAGEYQLTLHALPRLCLELLGVTGLAILVLAMVYEEKSLEAVLPTLGLFAAAAFRLMPSVNRVLSSIQSFRYAGPAIDILHKELSLANGTPAQAPSEVQPIPFQQSLAVDLVTFSYPSTEAQALKGVDLTIRRGTSVGLIGTTGSGKSTLVDIILGLLAPTKGVVRVDGVDIQSNLRGWQDQIGYVPQSIFLTDDTLRRNIAFGINAKLIDENAVWRALKSAQLDEFVKGLPDGLNTFVGERGVRLSGGQRQRIGIARALYYDPQILVLDEATSSLDMKTEQGVMDAVRSLHGKKTIIIVAHRLSTVEQCDRLYRLEQGCLVEERRV